MEDEKTVLLKLAASLTLCDNLSDVCGALADALAMIGRKDLADACDLSDESDFGSLLAEEGITTLHGIPLGE